MKNTVFATLAVALLFLAGCNNNESKNTNSDPESRQTGETAEKREISSDIAYISMDSLMMKFDMAVELMGEMEAKMKKAEGQIKSKSSKLERDVADYQEKASKGLLTRSQMAETEESLGKQQQQLMQLNDKLTGELAEEESVMNNRIYHFIMDYLKEFNADYRYSMIISTSAGGPILHADPSLDITKEILEGLNARYIKEKNAAAKNK